MAWSISVCHFFLALIGCQTVSSCMRESSISAMNVLTALRGSRLIDLKWNASHKVPNQTWSEQFLL